MTNFTFQVIVLDNLTYSLQALSKEYLKEKYLCTVDLLFHLGFSNLKSKYLTRISSIWCCLKIGCLHLTEFLAPTCLQNTGVILKASPEGQYIKILSVLELGQVWFIHVVDPRDLNIKLHLLRWNLFVVLN